jgi:Transposase DDE domain group 1
MNEALGAFKKTGEAQRLFMLVDYRARSWSEPQPVVIKVEANPEGTNRRAVVTNRPGCRVVPSAIYDEYAMRGESENRNKELKVELHAGRLSDHRFMANFFRLYLHTAAMGLLVRLRHAVVESTPTPAEPGQPDGLPTEALGEPARRKSFNKRRDRDPLGGGFACTWRTRLLKVAAEVITRSRRVIVRLSGSWPHLEQFLKVSRAVSPPCVASPSP